VLDVVQIKETSRWGSHLRGKNHVGRWGVKHVSGAVSQKASYFFIDGHAEKGENGGVGGALTRGGLVRVPKSTISSRVSTGARCNHRQLQKKRQGGGRISGKNESRIEITVKKGWGQNTMQEKKGE